MTGILENFLGTQGALSFIVKDVGSPWKEGFNPGVGRKVTLFCYSIDRAVDVLRKEGNEGRQWVTSEVTTVGKSGRITDPSDQQ